jgi:predicted metal-dependent hydrolase
MSTKKNRRKVFDLEIHAIKKDIKNIHLGVYPPNGRVRVAAPLKTRDETIRLIVASKMPWIKKQQSKFNKQDRQTKREYVSGESHFFMGNRYRLNVVDTNSKPEVVIKRKTYIDMYVNPKKTLRKREELMDNFYRSELKKRIPHLIKKWEKITGICVKELKIKKMKTKWGTCNPKCQRVWLNLELAKKPLHCSEYVLVHEMTHFIERNHTEKFKLLLKSFMPQWTHHKDELNNSTLGYSKWKYLSE